MKIFVIDFSKNPSLVEMCRQNGHIVEYEHKDGAAAYKNTKVFMPDIIVVNYAEKPSHGRLTAQKIHQRKMTSPIPIYFIDGQDSENEKIKDFGTPATKQELSALLSSSGDFVVRIGRASLKSRQHSGQRALSGS